jgi:flagellin
MRMLRTTTRRSIPDRSNNKGTAMPQIINTNMLSLNSQRNLNQSQAAQSTAIQRLSSGLRINSSKDDAAGLAISERFTTQIRGLNQAARNAQDAVSLSQTAEGALASVTSNLQRMRELAVQSANGTNSSGERDALQLEYDQLRQEINRISSQTAFAGVKLLDGSFSNVGFQVGSNAGETLSIASLANVGSSSLGTYTGAAVTGAAATAFTAIAAGDLTLDGPGSAAGVSLGAIGAAANATERAAQIRTAVNAVSAQTGVYAVADSGTTVSLRSTGAITIAFAGASATTATTGLTAATTATGTQTGFNVSSIATVAGANEAMVAMDGALSSVASSRATMGSIQSRFEALISNLQITSENLTASRSRIQDADFAEETAKLTRAQILQQAGTAMLAQANSAPQNVLALLR